MSNKTKILSELSKIVLEAMSTFSSFKKEIETIVRLKVEKLINKMNLVKRDEFEVLKKIVQKLANKNKGLKKNQKKTLSKLRKKKKKKKLTK